MSNEIKIALFALVALPLLAVWFFWGRPASDAAPGLPSAIRGGLAGDAVPAVLTAPSAPTSLLPFEPPPTSTGDEEGEARRSFTRHRPTFVNGAGASCDPPYLIDTDGMKHQKKGCP